MTSTTHLRTAAVITVVLAAVITGCATTDTAEPAPTTTTGAATPAPAQQWNPGTTTSAPAPRTSTRVSLPPQAAGLDRTSADAVARAALEVWFAWNPNTDTDRNDAARRALPLLTDNYAAAVTATDTVRSPGAQWQDWKAHSVTVTAEVAPSTVSVPPETSSEAYRVFDVTQTARTPDGQTVTADTVSVNVLLTSDAGTWEVDKISER